MGERSAKVSDAGPGSKLVIDGGAPGLRRGREGNGTGL